jgi:proline iminopeptidase
MLQPHTQHPATATRGRVPRLRTQSLTWIVNRVWQRRLVQLAVVVGIGALTGFALALVMPRGPMTTSQALTAMVAGVLAGVAAGFTMRSRWAMLLAPVTFVAAFELGRLGASGPMVDGIHLDSIYGIAAFVTGRGLTGVLVLLPMLAGVSYGVAAARRWPQTAAPARHARRLGLYLRRGVLALVTVAIVALAVLIARPATTDPIRGADGAVVPGSIAELTRVEIGGHKQALMIRGRSVDNPVLLFLAGGPGGSEIGTMRNRGELLERDFVVATWDERGAGKSAVEIDPTSTLTFEQMVSDTIAVTNYLRQRFDEQKIYLVGNSWGTLLGVLAAKQHPELYHAFVGSGQMVSTAATDRMFYEDTLAWAKRTGDNGLVSTLEKNGPPPYDNLWQYEPALSHEHDWNVYPGFDSVQDEIEMPGNMFVEEYSLMEKLRTMGAFMDTFSVLYPQLSKVDFRRDVPTLKVPVYVVQGAHEARGRAVPARQWFSELRAPKKQLIVFGRSGHKALFEQPDRFHAVMTDTVLADTYPKPR